MAGDISEVKLRAFARLDCLEGRVPDVNYTGLGKRTGGPKLPCVSFGEGNKLDSEKSY